jgi:hypothetical protein
MVIVTTLVTPPALKRSLARSSPLMEDASIDATHEMAEDTARRTSQ